MKRIARFAIIAVVLCLALPGQAQTRELPDFTELVERQGPAVVNISTTQAARRQAAPNVPQVPEMDENDPFYDFFRRFFPRQPPGPGAPPAARQRTGF